MRIWKIRVHANFHDVESYFRHLLIQTLPKPHDGVSLLSRFLEFKFDHKFRCPFDDQSCMQNFETFQNIFTPFKPNLIKTTKRSFMFDKVLKIKI